MGFNWPKVAKIEPYNWTYTIYYWAEVGNDQIRQWLEKFHYFCINTTKIISKRKRGGHKCHALNHLRPPKKRFKMFHNNIFYFIAIKNTHFVHTIEIIALSSPTTMLVCKRFALSVRIKLADVCKLSGSVKYDFLFYLFI